MADESKSGARPGARAGGGADRADQPGGAGAEGNGGAGGGGGLNEQQAISAAMGKYGQAVHGLAHAILAPATTAQQKEARRGNVRAALETLLDVIAPALEETPSEVGKGRTR